MPLRNGLSAAAAAEPWPAFAALLGGLSLARADLEAHASSREKRREVAYLCVCVLIYTVCARKIFGRKRLRVGVRNKLASLRKL